MERKPSRTPFIPEIRHAFEEGVTANVPVDYLWARQDPEEYSDRHAKQVRAALRDYGVNFLEEHPVWAVLAREATGARLIIIDGHHRTRFAPVYQIHEIPTKIITIELLARITGQKPEELTAQYLHQANNADYRLAQVKPNKFRGSRTLLTNGWVWTPLSVVEHFQKPSELPIITNRRYLATTSIFGNGNPFTAESPGVGERNGHIPEPRFPGVEGWVFDPEQRTYIIDERQK